MRCRARELAVCLPFLLEAGYSAVSARPTSRESSPTSPSFLVSRSPPTFEADALMAQRELAKVGHHRLPPADLIIAVCAHEAGAGVLHYDRDYDVIAKRTTLEFKSEWLAPPGTL